jgi:hypothetical protein
MFTAASQSLVEKNQ